MLVICIQTEQVLQKLKTDRRLTLKDENISQKSSAVVPLNTSKFFKTEQPDRIQVRFSTGQNRR